MTKKYLFLLIPFFLLYSSLRAQLVINEVSQGYSGNQEYVELLVVGTPTCNAIPCMDLRGYYIDDNNGNHATGAGVGIAQGCVRFTTDALWSCVPVGTLIVLYNDADLNPDVPAQDLSLTDGNCKLVIPISNCTLLERNTSTPSTTIATYPTTGFVPCGNWGVISMANSDDSFQSIDPSGNLVFSVSWGNNTIADIIYFAANQTGMVCSMTNSTNNNPFTQSNWVCVPVAGNQTPGSPNNAANAAWINSMNNSCTALTPLTVSGAVTNAGCSCTGSATVTAAGAIGPYTYSWAPAGGTSSTASGLCAGNYTVTATSANGCTQTATLSIASISPITTSITSTSVSCNGGSNGTATLTSNNTSGPVSYSWTPQGGNTTIASGLNAGIYTVSVLDSIGCTATATVAIAEPLAITITPTQSNVLCNGASNGSASVTVTGGTAPYSYTWSPGGGNTSVASGLSVGNYTCAISDANGCNASQTFSITEPASLSVTPSQANANCNGSATGSATVNVSGGTSPYTYTWSPVSGNASSANNLPAGNYTANISDANGCLINQSFSITEPPALTVTVSNNSSTCGASNATATASVSGGTGAYSYAWMPAGGSNSSASGLAAGNYTVNVSDANGCVMTGTTSIANISGASVTVTSTSVSCFGGNDGTATANAAGGTSPYLYAWSPTGGNNNTATALATGNYTVAVTDALGCITTATTNVTQPLAIISTLTASNVSCFGGSNGSVTTNASGGTGAFTYTWTPSGGNSSAATNLAAGNYSVTISDANGCSITTSTTVSEPTALNISTATTAISCNGGSNGSITATVTGGTPGYFYAWQPSGGNAATASSLSAGTYTLLVADANGCTQTSVTTLSQPQSMTISIAAVSVTCGTSNGSASSTVSGGTAPYSYTWQPSGGNSSNATALTAGIYTLVVTDNNGCVKTDTATVQNAATLFVTASATAVACNGGANGSANANANGGNPPYTYSWSGGGTSASINNLPAGNYTVTVTDANACPVTATVSVSQPPALSLTVTSVTVCNGQTATVTANASGGTAPYQYSYNGGAAQSSNLFAVTPGSSSTYSVIASDQHGCSSPVANFSVTVLPPLQVTVDDALVCPGATTTLTANASGGNGNYTYNWQPGNLSGPSVSVSTQNTTIYTVTVSDGCTTINASDTGQVSVYPVSSPTLLPTISGCAPLCVNFTVTASPNILNYQWNFGDNNTGSGTNPNHCYTNAGTFNVALTYTTTQGCSNTVTSNGMVHVFPKPVAAFAASSYETSTFDPQINFFDQSTGAPNSWQWYFGDGDSSVIQNPTHAYTASGDYLVWLYVQNSFGCKDSVSAEIKIKEDFLFYAPNAFTPDGDDLNEAFLPTGIGWDNTSYLLSVFDRWGNLIFATKDVAHGWDGTRHNQPVQEDTYVWKAEVKDLYGGTHQYKGVVSLVR